MATLSPAVRFAAMLVLAAPIAVADEPASRRMTVTGRVLAPDGKPVPHAAAMVIVHWKVPDRPEHLDANDPMTDHGGRCDASGRFRIEMPRTSSARHQRVTVAALATGYGTGWAELDPDAEPPTADVALRAEQVIRGRLVDINGQPARGVALRVRLVSGPTTGDTLQAVSRPDLYDLHWRDAPAWPGPAISDDDGRFALRGLGRGLLCPLVVDDPRFAIPITMIQTTDVDLTAAVRLRSTIKIEPGPSPKPITIVVQPSRTVTGRVTYADTGDPVPHALIGNAQRTHEADAEGRFRLTLLQPALVRFAVIARSPDGAPYLTGVAQADWPKGAVERSVDVALPRGAVVRGKVTEEGTGRPVAGAVVCLVPESPANPPQAPNVAALTGADGSYRVAGPPGRAYVVVQGPSDDYVLREALTGNGLPAARGGQVRSYAHAFRAIELHPDGDDEEVDLTLRPGRSIRGRVVGPDGEPIRDAWVFSRLILFSVRGDGWKRWTVMGDRGRGHVRDGRFALHGLAPDAEAVAYFLDPERKLGATVRVAGGSAEGPITVRLEPCATARGRVVDPDGKPIAGVPVGRLVSMLASPGPPMRARAAKGGLPFAEDADLMMIDPVHYNLNVQADADGRFTLPTLIPGALYRVIDIPAANAEPPPPRDFTVKAGETIDLGNIVKRRPPGTN